jgi:hypothetical protein
MDNQNAAQRAFASNSRIDFRNQDDDATNDPVKELEEQGIAIYDTNIIYGEKEENSYKGRRKSFKGLRKSYSDERPPVKGIMRGKDDFDRTINGNVQTPLSSAERTERLYSKQPLKNGKLKRTITTEFSTPNKNKRPRGFVGGNVKSLILAGVAFFLLIVIFLVCYLLVPRDLRMTVQPPQRDSDNYGISMVNGLLTVNATSLVNLVVKNYNFYSVSVAAVDIKFTWILSESNKKIQDFTEATTSDMDMSIGKRSARNISIPLFFVYAGDISKDQLLQDFLQRCHTGNKGLDLEYVAEFQVSHLFSARKKQIVKTKTLLPCPMSSRQISDTLAELNVSI